MRKHELPGGLVLHAYADGSGVKIEALGGNVILGTEEIPAVVTALQRIHAYNEQTALNNRMSDLFAAKSSVADHYNASLKAAPTVAPKAEQRRTHCHASQDHHGAIYLGKDQYIGIDAAKRLKLFLERKSSGLCEFDDAITGKRYDHTMFNIDLDALAFAISRAELKAEEVRKTHGASSHRYGFVEYKAGDPSLIPFAMMSKEARTLADKIAPKAGVENERYECGYFRVDDWCRYLVASDLRRAANEADRYNWITYPVIKSRFFGIDYASP